MKTDFFFSCNWKTDEKIQASYLIITVWRIVTTFIWIIMYTHLNPNLLGQLSSGALPASCLFTRTCFCRILIKFEMHRDEYLPVRGLWQNCSVWLCGFPDWPVFPLKPEQTKTMGFDGRISGCVATLHHMVHALAAARCDSHSLTLAFVSTMDHGSRGWVSNPLICN